MSEEIEVRLSGEEAERGEAGKVTDRRGKFDLTALWEKNKLSVILGGLGILFLGVGILSTIIISSKSNSSEIEILPTEEKTESKDIMVHIAGAVLKPGLYQLKDDARVNDALVAAGGLAEEADRQWFAKNVNLAQKLSDGIKMYIPFRDEVGKVGKVEAENKGIVAGSQSIFVQETEGKININTASVQQLDNLPGIGPAYAQRIVDYRESNGLFSSIEQITKIKGIGEATFEKIKDKITVF